MILGFLSDSHGCFEALEKGLEALRRHGAEQIFHLGDSVGYFPGWSAADALRRESIPCLKGNHEAMLLLDEQDPAKDPMTQLGTTARQASPVQLKWVSQLPQSLRIEQDNVRILLVHGSPREPLREYIYPDTSLEPFFDVDADVVVMGHTHRADLREVGGKTFINTGSCALPRHPGGLGSAAVLDTGTGHGELIRFPIGNETRKAAARLSLHEAIVNRIAQYPES
jgi:putative phosphoesterase